MQPESTMSSLMDGLFSWGFLCWTLGLHRHTACSQVQPYQGLHRTAMFEHANPQPSFFPNFNRCRCWHYPPPTPDNHSFCNVLHTKQTRAGLREAFVRPSKQRWTCLVIKHLFDSKLWRELQHMNCTKARSALISSFIYIDTHQHCHTFKAAQREDV